MTPASPGQGSQGHSVRSIQKSIDQAAPSLLGARGKQPEEANGETRQGPGFPSTRKGEPRWGGGDRINRTQASQIGLHCPLGISPTISPNNYLMYANLEGCQHKNSFFHSFFLLRLCRCRGWRRRGPGPSAPGRSGKHKGDIHLFRVVKVLLVLCGAAARAQGRLQPGPLRR